MSSLDNAPQGLAAGTVTAVLCTRNRPTLATACVRRLLECDPPADEILVVDQSDDRATRKRLRELPDPGCRLRVAVTGSRGLSKARNLALIEARAPLVAFTDDDCLPRHDWIGAVRTAFADSAEAVAVTGAAVPERREGLDARALRATTWQPAERRLHREVTDPARIGGGFNLSVVRHRALEQIGGFDERLGAGVPLQACEDTEFLYRILRRGEAVLYSPDVVVSHDAWRDEADQAKTDRGYALGGGGWAALAARQGDFRPLGIVLRQILSASARSAGMLLTGRPHHALHHLRVIAATCRGLQVGLASPRQRAPFLAELLDDRAGRSAPAGHA